MTVEAALAKLGYLLSKPELTSSSIRHLISRPLRGELTPSTPVPIYSTPVESGDQIRSLFKRVIQCSSAVGSMVSIEKEDDIPEEFSLPMTFQETEAASKALMPFLLSQAAARSDSTLLTNLIDSLLSTDTGSNSNNVVPNITSLAVLDQCSTATFQTPLHIAVITSNLSNVKLLLSHGASIHLRDIFQHSILYYAARLSTPIGKEIVQCLVEAGGLLSEIEIGRGAVGCEIIRAEKRGLVDEIEMWKLALRGVEGYERAKKCAQDLFI